MQELDDWAKIDEANAARCQQDPNALCNGYHVIVKDGRVYEGSLWAVADKPYRWCSYLLTRGMSDFGRNMCLASVKIYEVGEEPRSLTPAECDAIDKWVGAVVSRYTRLRRNSGSGFSGTFPIWDSCWQDRVKFSGLTQILVFSSAARR